MCSGDSAVPKVSSELFSVLTNWMSRYTAEFIGFFFPPVRPSSIRPSIRPSVCPSVVEKMFTEVLRKFYGHCFNVKTPPLGTESCLTFAFTPGARDLFGRKPHPSTTFGSQKQILNMWNCFGGVPMFCHLQMRTLSNFPFPKAAF